MSLHHFPQIISDSVMFYFDSRRTANYVGSTVTSAIETKSLTATNVTRSGTTTTFNNTQSNIATSYITDSVHDSSYIVKSNMTVMATFKIFSDFNTENPAWWRQTPISFGTDATKGMWAIEVFKGLGITIRQNFDFDGTYGADILTGKYCELNKWINVAFVNDGMISKTYVNGIFCTQRTISSLTVTSAGTARLSIGAQNAGTPIYGLIGSVDSAIVYSRALSDAEIFKNATNFLARCA